MFSVGPNWESNTEIRIDDLKNFMKKSCGQKVKMIPQKDFEFIIDNITVTSQKKKKVFEPYMLVQTFFKTIYIDYWHGAYDENMDSVAISPKAIYLLRKYSDYINQILPEDLQDDQDVKNFGIPKDYHYIEVSLDTLYKYHRIPNFVYKLVPSANE